MDLPLPRAVLLCPGHPCCLSSSAQRVINGLTCAGLSELFLCPFYIQTTPDYSQCQPCHWVMVIPLPRLARPGWYPGISLVFHNTAGLLWKGRVTQRP